jgi:hypothetical protein
LPLPVAARAGSDAADLGAGIGMARIEGQIVIGRRLDMVFDYVADQRNEPQYTRR